MFEALADFWNGIVGAFAQALLWLHDVLVPLTGEEVAWGFAIIALTFLIRLFLLPLAIKQIRSMRAMQELQPKIKAIQNKYETDRELLKKDPERYKEQREKMNREMMALYQEEGVNPASGCLPLIAQLPVFFALFDVLQSTDIEVIQPLQQAEFFFLPALGTTTSAAGLAGWLMVGLMVGTMALAQWQMMRTRGSGAAPTQQKVMMFGMPVFLAFIAQGFPLGVLVYWVTTNVWQFGQQAVVLREVSEEDTDDSEGSGRGSSGGQADARAGKTSRESQHYGGGGSPKSDGAGGDGKARGADDGGKGRRKRGTAQSGDKGHIPTRPS